MDEPTCFFESNASATSPISVLWRFLISCRIFSMLVATLAIHPTHSMYRSLPTTCVVAIGTSKPSSPSTKSCNSRALSPCAAPVPTAPRNFPVMHLGRISLNLTRWRLISSIQTATFSPNVIGTAAWPWVLPSITVLFSLSAITHRVSISLRSD